MAKRPKVTYIPPPPILAAVQVTLEEDRSKVDIVKTDTSLASRYVTGMIRLEKEEELCRVRDACNIALTQIRRAK